MADGAGPTFQRLPPLLPNRRRRPSRRRLGPHTASPPLPAHEQPARGSAQHAPTSHAVHAALLFGVTATVPQPAPFPPPTSVAIRPAAARNPQVRSRPNRSACRTLSPSAPEAAACAPSCPAVRSEEHTSE